MTGDLLQLEPADLAALAAFDTPTICNALEVVAPDRRAVGFTTAPLVCPYPDLPPMVGFARTARIRSKAPPDGPPRDRGSRIAYYDYVAAGGPLPSISVIEDLDGEQAGFGAFWGEVNTHLHKALGCRGVVTNGSIRDIPANAAGFQMLAGKLAPSHAHVHVVDFGGSVQVAGMPVASGDLVHADRHGAVVVPLAVARAVPDAARLLMRREAVVLAAARAPGFDVLRLAEAWGEAEDIH